MIKISICLASACSHEPCKDVFDLTVECVGLEERWKKKKNISKTTHKRLEHSEHHNQRGEGNTSPPWPHVDQAVPRRWMIAQEGGSSGKPRGHCNLKTRAALYGSVCVWQSLCLKSLLSVLCDCGLPQARWKMKSGPVLIAEEDIVSLNKGGSML